MSKIKFSIIIPVYNRPEEIRELLDSLTAQSYPDFEIIVIEDGSDDPCESIVFSYKDQLNIYYYYKTNSGPGLSRNFGAEKAVGNYFIFFDSDCLVPEHYMATVKAFLENNFSPAYGGPDKAHASFTPVQKAINYSMTSFFTTGGIRGGRKQLEKFHPRSFNMGFSREVYEKTGGYSTMRFGEDIDLSIRIFENRFTTTLIEEAFVYHKRRTDLKKFFKQVFNSGIARINLYKKHPKSMKIVHTFPALFTIGIFLMILLSLTFSWVFMLPLLFYTVSIFADALVKEQHFKVASLAVIASFVQLTGYGSGFLKAVWNRLILHKGEFHAYTKNFYK